MLLEAQSKKINRISLTPLIDVVFILLLFFMLSSSFSHWFSIDISMPTGSKLEAREAARIQLLNQQGLITYNGSTFSIGNLAFVKSLKADGKNQVFIDVESNVNTQTIVKLISVLNEQGIKKVALGDVFIKSKVQIEAL
ncbi:ExbD/TolR family protein [Alkalimarinus alittae]|uniref:Biopolymer transporter ExbD n=1 Tax=Alkalimarinus alittae TaxID=2961619 RepID=A0ABY6MXQ9_9ALTE|nr:biopolymer transporter ExbD [Alkalimarinus alittae]UZE94567.1 biopolymer transporter ExbD [Alkalimarinus alittae]